MVRYLVGSRTLELSWSRSVRFMENTCRSTKGLQPIGEPWCCYIYLHNWVIFRANVGKYSIHGAYGQLNSNIEKHGVVHWWYIEAYWTEGRVFCFRRIHHLQPLRSVLSPWSVQMLVQFHHGFCWWMLLIYPASINKLYNGPGSSKWPFQGVRMSLFKIDA